MKGHSTLFLALFLLLIGAVVMYYVGGYGWSYYTTAEDERPFHPLYNELKPTGYVGHGLGIVGTALIVFGVVMYSGRKRLRLLHEVGKIKYYLEVHIFLCLLGPGLVLYHTTFKFGGLVAVSFWSMMAVVASGVLGRYFYVQLPKGIQGNELSEGELAKEHAGLGEELKTQYGLSEDIIQKIDKLAQPPKSVTAMSLLETLNFFIINDLTRRSKLQSVFSALETKALPQDVLARLNQVARHRMMLTRRIAFLQKFRQLFYYWHVIHLPFALVMFVILCIHVGVAVAFGYTWVW
jgi:hypothetical protein